jgi:hypothetical protein
VIRYTSHRNFAGKSLAGSVAGAKWKVPTKDTFMKTSVIALTVAAAVGLGSVPAFAHERDGDHHEYQHHERHWDHGGGVTIQPGYAWTPTQYAPQYYGPQPYYAQPAYGYDSGDAVGAAIAGAIIGGLVTQMAVHHHR